MAFSPRATTNSTSLGRLPSVCLMMPTANRPELVLRALEMMGRQEYPSSLLKEVVVVDDSPSDLVHVHTLARPGFSPTCFFSPSIAAPAFVVRK